MQRQSQLLQSEQPLSRLDLICLVGFVVLLSICIFDGYLAQSFWLDETISSWIVSAGISDVIERAQTYQGQSPLYYLLLFCWKSVFGVSEIALRSMSLVLIISSSLLLIAIARELNAMRVGICALPFFITLDSVQRAFSARPYALALTFYLLSLLYILRWQRHKENVSFALSASFAVLTFYAHPLFIFGFWLHLLVYIKNYNSRAALQGVVAVLVSIAMLWPYFPQLGALANRAGTLTFAPVPSWRILLESIFPLTYALYVVAALSAAVIAKKSGFLPAVNWRQGAFLLIWSVSGALIFALVSLMSGHSLFLERYFLWSSAGLALLAGWVVSNLRSSLLGIVFALALMVVREGGRSWQIEGWREAALSLSEKKAPILLRSGLIETSDLLWLLNPAHKEYLSAPLSTYVQIESSRVYLLPRDLTKQDTGQYLDRLLNNIFTNFDELDLVDFEPRSELLNKLIFKASNGTFAQQKQQNLGILSLQSYSRLKSDD